MKKKEESEMQDSNNVVVSLLKHLWGDILDFFSGLRQEVVEVWEARGVVDNDDDV